MVLLEYILLFVLKNHDMMAKLLKKAIPLRFVGKILRYNSSACCVFSYKATQLLLLMNKEEEMNFKACALNHKNTHLSFLLPQCFHF